MRCGCVGTAVSRQGVHGALQRESVKLFHTPEYPLPTLSHLRRVRRTGRYPDPLEAVAGEARDHERCADHLLADGGTRQLIVQQVLREGAGGEEARDHQKCASSQMAPPHRWHKPHYKPVWDRQHRRPTTIGGTLASVLAPLSPCTTVVAPSPPPHLVHGVEAKNRRCPVGVAASILLRCDTALELADEVVLQTLAKGGQGSGFNWAESP